MLRKLLVLTVGMASLTLAVNAQEKDLTIKEIMKKGHNKTDGLLTAIGSAAKDMKWDDAASGAKLLKAYGEGLGKLKPSKGTEESWKKLAEKYKTNTTAVATAVEKKDAKGTQAALGAIGKSCGECHSAHKGK